ncbi:MAG TPA: type II toxin-antitoxin system RelE/ParE family toxin [Pyrinomonadaceae bacterium]|jgi:mRNA interferase RelE/StbE
MKAAVRDLENLDKSMAHRIARKIKWLAENAETIQPKGLQRNLAGLAEIREGDYRIIYEIIHAEEIVVIHFIGHRREVYKNK